MIQHGPAAILSGGHHFQIPGGDLMRRTLLEQLKAKGPRLTVLITDTRNVQASAQLVQGAEERTSVWRIHRFTSLEKLLLLTRGVVAISASAQDQYSWFSPAGGGRPRVVPQCPVASIT